MQPPAAAVQLLFCLCRCPPALACELYYGLSGQCRLCCPVLLTAAISAASMPARWHGKHSPLERWRERLARGLTAFFLALSCSPLAAAHPYVGSRQRRAGRKRWADVHLPSYLWGGVLSCCCYPRKCCSGFINHRLALDEPWQEQGEAARRSLRSHCTLAVPQAGAALAIDKPVPSHKDAATAAPPVSVK